MSYLEIVEHYEECYKMHGDNHKGVDWPKEEDVEKRYKVMLDIMRFDDSQKENASVLDFGCGLGHMYDYMRKEKIQAEYEGLDISNVFVSKCQEKYPEVKFHTKNLLESKEEKLDRNYDYIILNGVLTEKRTLSYEEMFEYFKELIKKVYQFCDCGIAFNVMSKDVDWEREDLFHLPLNELSHFLTKDVSRDFIIRYDYGLYEYTVYVYKRRR